MPTSTPLPQSTAITSNIGHFDPESQAEAKDSAGRIVDEGDARLVDLSHAVSPEVGCG
jgi:hypothetical protein